MRLQTEATTKTNRLHRGIKNDRILRILLCNTEGTLTKYRIAKLADAQQTQVTLLLRKLEEAHMVSGTSVIDHKGLLVKWSRIPMKYDSQSYMLPDVMKILKKAKLDYGLTTNRAESMVNGYLFPSRTELYIRPDDSDEWHNLLVEEGAMVGGGNIRLRWYDEQVLYNSFSMDGYSIVAIPQLIVDLLREGSSSAEAADMMMQKYPDLLRLNRLRSKQLIQSADAPPR
jgi:hypothetical protein